MEEINPYAPPSCLPVRQVENFEDGRVWRDGPLMIVRSGAALPPRCFVTGKPTTKSVDIKVFWQGRFPLIVATQARKIKMSVPISPEVYQWHLRAVNFGFARLIIGLLLLLCAYVLSGLSFSLVFLLLGTLTAISGFYSSSRQPVELQIVRMEGDLLVLGNVHPDCLAELPTNVELFVNC